MEARKLKSPEAAEDATLEHILRILSRNDPRIILIRCPAVSRVLRFDPFRPKLDRALQFRNRFGAYVSQLGESVGVQRRCFRQSLHSAVA